MEGSGLRRATRGVVKHLNGSPEDVFFSLVGYFPNVLQRVELR